MAKTASLKNTIRSREVPAFNGSHPQSFGGATGSWTEVAHRLLRGAGQDEGRPGTPPQGQDGHALPELPADTGRIEANTPHQQRRKSVGITEIECHDGSKSVRTTTY